MFLPVALRLALAPLMLCFGSDRAVARARQICQTPSFLALVPTRRNCTLARGIVTTDPGQRKVRAKKNRKEEEEEEEEENFGLADDTNWNEYLAWVHFDLAQSNARARQPGGQQSGRAFIVSLA